MATVLCPDICVIGAGSAGLSVAAGAAAFGVPVVLIERGQMGGECLNTGCVPSKALIAAAKHAHAVHKAAEFGVIAGEPVIDFKRFRRMCALSSTRSRRMIRRSGSPPWASRSSGRMRALPVVTP